MERKCWAAGKIDDTDGDGSLVDDDKACVVVVIVVVLVSVMMIKTKIVNAIHRQQHPFERILFSSFCQSSYGEMQKKQFHQNIFGSRSDVSNLRGARLVVIFKNHRNQKQIIFSSEMLHGSGQSPNFNIYANIRVLSK